MATKMWMIRGDGGKLYDDFRDKQVVAIGWSQLAPYVKPGCSREQLFTRYQELEPQTKPGTVRSGASQVWRFVNEMQKGDWAITYSPSNRTYLIGKIASDFEFHAEWLEDGMGIARKVKWNAEVKWFTEFGHLNRGDMLTSEQHRCHNEKKKFQRRV